MRTRISYSEPPVSLLKTAFLKILLLYQKRKYQSDPIRSAVRSDPRFVDGLPFTKKCFSDYSSVLWNILGFHHWSKTRLSNLFFILQARNTLRCGILKAMLALQNWDASDRSTFNGTCDFSHFTAEKMSIDFSEGLWNHISRGKNRDYFMESACVRVFDTSWWSIWNRTSGHSERVRFLIQNQRVWKSRTKRFPCCNLFILYILRFFLFIQL